METVNTLNNSLTWEIVETPVLVNGMIVDSYKSLVRSDNDQVISIVKKSYTPTTNEQFKNTIAEIQKINGFEISGFAESREGGKVLCWLKNPENKKILDWSSNDYMVLGNSHDYSSGFFAGTTNHLLRCSNQFTKLHKNSSFHVPHTKSSTRKINDFVREFETYIEETQLFYEVLEGFGEVKIDKLIIDELIQRLVKLESEEKITKQKELFKTDLERSILRETNEVGMNLFGLWNGVTHYTTHTERKVNRMFGNPFGTLAEINNKGFDFCGEVLMSELEKMTAETPKIINPFEGGLTQYNMN